MADLLIPFVDQVEDGLEEESQQIEAEQEGSQVLAAVAEIVFQMVAFGFEHVIIFVLNLPAGPAWQFLREGTGQWKCWEYGEVTVQNVRVAGF